MTMPDNVRELVGFVEWAMENDQPINGEHIVALRDALQDAYRSPNSVGSGPAGGDDLNLLERKVPRYDFTVSDLVNEALRRVLDGDLSAPGGRVGTLSDLTAHGLILSLKDVIERAAEEQGRSANRASQSPSGYEAEGGMNPDPSAGDQWQGIETAPKVHGQMILSTNRHGVVDTICWNQHDQAWDDGFYAGLDDDVQPPLQPKFWMPLPPSPVLDEGSSAQGPIPTASVSTGSDDREAGE